METRHSRSMAFFGLGGLLLLVGVGSLALFVATLVASRLHEISPDVSTIVAAILVALLWGSMGYYPASSGNHFWYAFLTGVLPGYVIIFGWESLLKGHRILSGVELTVM